MLKEITDLGFQVNCSTCGQPAVSVIADVNESSVIRIEDAPCEKHRDEQLKKHGLCEHGQSECRDGHCYWLTHSDLLGVRV